MRGTGNIQDIDLINLSESVFSSSVFKEDEVTDLTYWDWGVRRDRRANMGFIRRENIIPFNYLEQSVPLKLEKNQSYL